MIIQSGEANLASLSVPDFFLQNVPPQNNIINGVPTNILGIVGTATWGAKDSPVFVGDITEYSQNFGQIQTNKYDIGTIIQSAFLQGTNVAVCVRVTDGTDLAAFADIFDTTTSANIPGVELTALYTGTTGNTVQVLISKGSSYTPTVPTYMVSIALPNSAPEKFDNIGGVGNVFWQNVVNAINNGQGSFRPPSQLVVASLSDGIGKINVTAGGSGYTSAPAVVFTGGDGTGVAATAVVNAGAVESINITNPGTGYTIAPGISFTGGGGGTGAAATALIGSQNAPKLQTYQLASGTDGISGVTDDTLLGTDVAPRTGMYALRNTKASVVILADVTDTDTWADQDAYGLSEGSYMMLTGASGQSISAAITAKQSAGLDSYSSKVILGDWIYFNDTVNNQLRVISPQGFIGGVLVTLSPEQSSLNKPMQGIVATQTTYQNKVYSYADLQELALAGIDVITKPLPRGNVFGGRFGRNSSSEIAVRGDNYTRMTYFLDLTLNTSMGIFVGLPQTVETEQNARDTLKAFLQNLKTLNMIDDFSVRLDSTNNPPPSVARGNMIADVKVRYLGIIEYFICRLEGGQTVTVEKQSTLPNF